MKIEEWNSVYSADVLGPLCIPWLDLERQFIEMTVIFLEISGKYRNLIFIIHSIDMLEMSLSISLGFV